MNNFLADRRSPLGLFPGEPTPRLYDRTVEVLRTRHWRFLVMPTGKGFMQVSLDKSQPDADDSERRHERTRTRSCGSRSNGTRSG